MRKYSFAPIKKSGCFFIFSIKIPPPRDIGVVANGKAAVYGKFVNIASKVLLDVCQKLNPSNELFLLCKIATSLVFMQTFVVVVTDTINAVDPNPKVAPIPIEAPINPHTVPPITAPFPTPAAVDQNKSLPVSPDSLAEL